LKYILALVFFVLMFVVAPVTCVIYTLSSPQNITQPKTIPKQEINLKTVDIQLEQLYAPPKVIDGKYNHTFRIRNNGPTEITVAWDGYSSLSQQNDRGTVTVKGMSYADVIATYRYIKPGMDYLSCSIHYSGQQKRLLDQCYIKP
jgi:hypothetical protein